MKPNTAELQPDNQALLEELYAEMAPKGLLPLWEALANLVTKTPQTPVISAKWKYGDIRTHLMRAGELISAKQAERRVLVLENPGLQGTHAITSTLYAGLQLILPGEVAPCHRHAQSALRFVMEGSGAFTAIDGEKAMMEKYDLVLTPNWQWHDHGNTTDDPMIWLDGLDIPLVNHFDTSFAETLAGTDAHPESMPPGDTLSRYGKNLRPIRGSQSDRRPKHMPLFHYPYKEWHSSLTDLSNSEAPDPHFGYALEFINPSTGGAIMPTISAHVRLLPRGFETAERRSTDGSVYVVLEGSGSAMVGDVEHTLEEGDFFVVPSWHPVQIKADQDLTLFGYSDRTSQEKLNLFRDLKS